MNIINIYMYTRFGKQKNNDLKEKVKAVFIFWSRDKVEKLANGVRVRQETLVLPHKVGGAHKGC